MAGKMCPQCGQYTFFARPFGRECMKCGFRMVLPAKDGEGQRCANCGKCRSCGALFIKSDS